MTIAWDHFTPYTALAGGGLIGLAAAALLLGNGRIAGISGIVGALLRPAAGERAWRIAFIAGLVAAPMAYRAWSGTVPASIETPWALLLPAGFLVGLGTRYANGCTSGHGVCGLARLSPRSLAATLVFMAAGFAVVFLLRHVLLHGGGGL